MDEDIQDDETQQPEQTIDLTTLPNVTHRFDHIVGNQLMCGLHDTCSSVTVSPTAVLEPDEKGEMQLVEKAVR